MEYGGRKKVRYLRGKPIPNKPLLNSIPEIQNDRYSMFRKNNILEPILTDQGTNIPVKPTEYANLQSANLGFFNPSNTENQSTWEYIKNFAVDNYLTRAGAGLGTLGTSTMQALGLNPSLLLGGIAAAGAAYGGKKLYDYYRKRKQQQNERNLLNEQIKYYSNSKNFNEKDKSLDFLISLTPSELDKYIKDLLNGKIKSDQRLISTIDLIDLVTTEYGNNSNLVKIAYAQSINDYNLSIKNKRQLPQKIINFIKIVNQKI